MTSLRIAAAVWVLVYHFRDHLGLGLGHFGAVARGYLGVDLFFTLSGFILSHVYLRAVEEKRFNYGSFLWARLARVYPVHLATLAGMALIWLVATKSGAAFGGELFDLRVLPQNLVLIHAWGTTPTVSWNFPSWSISAEWFAYLLFPAAALLCLGVRRWPVAGVALAVGLFAAMFLTADALGVLFTNMTAQVGALRIVPAFLLGAALHQLGRNVALPLWGAWLGVAVSIVCIVIATSVGTSDMVTWPALGLLIFSLAETSKHAAPNPVAAPVFVYLGEVSYAVYMTHLPVDIIYFHGLEKLAPGLGGPLAWAAWTGVFAAILAASIATHHLIERPARTWMRAHDPFRPRAPGLGAAAIVRGGS